MSTGTISVRSPGVACTVGNVMHPVLPYQPADNADPDSDSDGTVIGVSRP
jgi:hypothetical protein